MLRYDSRMPLTLYNTFSNKDEEFSPIEEGKVRLYTCGPTVYGRPHIGNYSSFLMADLLRRWLEVSGYAVTHVKNITDVGHLVADADEGEDKIEKQAKQEKADPLAIARKYTEQYLADEKALNMLEPQYRPKATDTIAEMIAIIETLVAGGHAYETKDGVYFAVESFPDYGKLSGNILKNLTAGARVAVKEEKRHPADFALWKKCIGANAHHMLRWNSPWGEGFPGWHIECSAMSQKFLGQQIDIHTGGEDNIFPHHECEIAQSECSGPKPFVRYWIHKRRIDIGSMRSPQGVQKMSKSLGNVLTISDIEQMGYSPLDLRYYFLSVHYRTQLKFAKKGLEDAKKARKRILEWMAEVEQSPRSDADIMSWKQKFSSAMNADLNTPEALASVFDLMAYSRNEGVLGACREMADIIRRTFGCFDPQQEQVIPAEVVALLEEREIARSNKDFKASDELRDAIAAMGYEVRDLPEGQKITAM